MKIYIGSDHAGLELKGELIPFIQGLGYDTEDKGAFSFDPQDDYPDFIKPVAEAVAKDSNAKGIVIGKSGQGEAMCANRIKGVRAAVFYGPPFQWKELSWLKWFSINSAAGNMQSSEFATLQNLVKLSREHNNANVLSLAGGFIDFSIVQRIVKLWLETPFTNEERHVRRLKKLDA